MLTSFVKTASLQHRSNSNKAQNERASISSLGDSLFSYHLHLSDSRRHLQIRFFNTWNTKPLSITDWRQATLQCQPLAARPAGDSVLISPSHPPAVSVPLSHQHWVLLCWGHLGRVSVHRARVTHITSLVKFTDRLHKFVHQCSWTSVCNVKLTPAYLN